MSGSSINENVATTACTVDIYPFESTPYTIQGGQILSCSVQKSIRGGAPGTFSIVLAPGGPQGVDDPLPWALLITPMSLVVIAMQRGSRAQVVMVGVVTAPAEAIEWGEGAVRRQVIRGFDFSYFFSMFNWATFSTLGLTSATAFGAAMNFTPGGFAIQISPAIFGQGGSGTWANPITVGQAFYKLMLLVGGMMGTTRVPYHNQTTVLLSQAFATVWEAFLDVGIPFGDMLATVDGDWMTKFQDIFPFPWYEFFAITAPQGYYVPPTTAQGGSNAPSPVTITTGPDGTPIMSTTVTAKTPNGTLFRSSSMPSALPAAPTVVARVNPLPALTLTVSGLDDPGTFGNMDMARWNALAAPGQSEDGMPTLLPFTPDSGVFSSSLMFSVDEVRNFYYVNPRWMGANMLPTGVNVAPTALIYLTAGDAASIHRYSYRPEFFSTSWMYDPVFGGVGLTTQQFAQTAATLLARTISYWHPTPLMVRSVVTLPLRPDIMPGYRFRCMPSKSTISWDFYIDAVQHDYSFGGRGPSTTTLQLSRGLPTTIYESGGATNSLLRSIHLGNAMRTSNPPGGTQSSDSYVAGLPPGLGPPLQTVVPRNNAQVAEFMGNIGSVYVTPQQK